MQEVACFSAVSSCSERNEKGEREEEEEEKEEAAAAGLKQSIASLQCTFVRIRNLTCSGYPGR